MSLRLRLPNAKGGAGKGAVRRRRLKIEAPRIHRRVSWSEDECRKKSWFSEALPGDGGRAGPLEFDASFFNGTYSAGSKFIMSQSTN